MEQRNLKVNVPVTSLGDAQDKLRRIIREINNGQRDGAGWEIGEGEAIAEQEPTENKDTVPETVPPENEEPKEGTSVEATGTSAPDAVQGEATGTGEHTEGEKYPWEK